MTQLKKSGTVTYAWLGVAGQTLTSDVAAMFGLKASSGALVEQVTANGPAAAAGIKGGTRTVTVQGAQYTLGGDIITAVNGKPITTFDELLAAVDARQPGDKLTLTLQRGDATLTVTATLAVRPSNF